jgi:hypothetical protein
MLYNVYNVIYYNIYVFDTSDLDSNEQCRRVATINIHE